MENITCWGILGLHLSQENIFFMAITLSRIEGTKHISCVGLEGWGICTRTQLAHRAERDNFENFGANGRI
jgi:hypothetical protein